MMISQCKLILTPAMLPSQEVEKYVYMWNLSTHLFLIQIKMILGGCVALEIGSEQAIVQEETSSFMVEFCVAKQG
jgi:hypothetical protein